MTEAERKIIGMRLRTFRKEITNLRQQDLAAEMEIATKTLNFAENGRVLPSQKLINGLSKKYKLNQDWLTTGKGDPQSKNSFDPNSMPNIITRLNLLEMQVSSLQETIENLIEKLEQE